MANFAAHITPLCTLNGSDLTPYYKGSNLERVSDELESTNADSLGVKQRVIGLIGWTASVDLQHDSAAALDTILRGLDPRTAVNLVFQRTTGTPSGTDPKFTISVYPGNYVPLTAGAIGQLPAFTLNCICTGDVTVATS